VTADPQVAKKVRFLASVPCLSFIAATMLLLKYRFCLGDLFGLSASALVADSPWLSRARAKELVAFLVRRYPGARDYQAPRRPRTDRTATGLAGQERASQDDFAAAGLSWDAPTQSGLQFDT
jgi:hypothetical protein